MFAHPKNSNVVGPGIEQYGTFKCAEGPNSKFWVLKRNLLANLVSDENSFFIPRFGFKN